ncbi:MAG: YeeE/YedE family protein, partial [Alphaproteobacteria bacterium]
GWGLAGFCPGGALPALGAGVAKGYGLVAAMADGMLAARAGLRAADAKR